ncbi:plasmid mobilization protein [Burkholderia vietnamiensis]|uniref:plasmid mobilization protein n=1 Tax=Burkholderia vietnamiensis TaxID=60552 RepID=UPI001FC9FE47|nr:hypothetical protein [Burkholderia vietnamiensis]
MDMFAKTLRVFAKYPVPKGWSLWKPRRLSPAGALRASWQRAWGVYGDGGAGAMARPKKVSGGLKKTVAFRLTEADHAAYKEKFEASGLSQSEFFRRYVLTNTTTVVARPRASADKQQMLFLFNKASNNLNQLAYRANSDHLAGTLTESVYVSILDTLQQLARLMKASINHVD